MSKTCLDTLYTWLQFIAFLIVKSIVALCGTCVGQLIPAIIECGISFDAKTFGCVAGKSGNCIGCACKVITDMGLKILEPVCNGIINGRWNTYSEF